MGFYECLSSCALAMLNGIMADLKYRLHLARKYGHYMFKEANSFQKRSPRKTVTFEEQIMSNDIYTSTFSRQLEAVVFNMLVLTHAVLKRNCKNSNQNFRLSSAFRLGLLYILLKIDLTKEIKFWRICCHAMSTRIRQRILMHANVD